jgi:hypothetical protein
VLLVGPPGSGKTAAVYAQYDYVEAILASTLGEEDISGLPYRTGKYDYRTVPAMFRRLEEADAAGKSTALFLDELDKARRSVADTLLTLVASRRVGDATLPARTCILAAANPPELGGSDGIGDTMISRFCVQTWVPDPAFWAALMTPDHTSIAAKRIIALVRNGEIPLVDIAGEGLDRRITSPRTLTMALEKIKEGHPQMIAGLLTAGVASHILTIIDGDDELVLEASLDILRGKLIDQESRRKPARPEKWRTK